MQNKNEIHETITSKGKGKSIHIKTSGYSYWGRLFEYKDQTVVLKPYYTNQDEGLQIRDNSKKLSLDEIIDVD